MIRLACAAIGLAGIVAAASPAKAVVVYYALQSGIQGGQTQIDVAHTSTWTFTTGSSWTFGGGTFEMKDGPSTTADITLSVYDGGNALVAAKTLTNAPFTQSFNPIPFLFAAPLALLANTTYSVKLTSPAADAANQQYFIKGNNSTLSFVDEEGGLIPDGLVTFVSDTNGGNGADVPEPMMLAVMGVGLAGLAVARSRRSKKPL